MSDLTYSSSMSLHNADAGLQCDCDACIAVQSVELDRQELALVIASLRLVSKLPSLTSDETERALTLADRLDEGLMQFWVGVSMITAGLMIADLITRADNNYNVKLESE
jgi:hypothetical protein